MGILFKKTLGFVVIAWLPSSKKRPTACQDIPFSYHGKKYHLVGLLGDLWPLKAIRKKEKVAFARLLQKPEMQLSSFSVTSLEQKSRCKEKFQAVNLTIF